MGAIKDIVDLCIKLRDEVGDRKAAEAIGKIQSLTLALQSEQATIVEKNTELLKANLDLERKVLNLETTHAHAMGALQEKHRDEIAKIKASNAHPKGDQLDEICHKMLITLANYDGRDGITNNELIQHLGLPKANGDHHFDQLANRKFVNTSGGVMGRGMFWHVTAAGRDYMANNGLL
jgi:DNA-binding MarR family transcriptional regulator